MSTINKDLTAGAFWTGFSKYTNQFIGLLIGVFLSRLLTPADFGIVAMVFVFSGFLGVFNDAGIKSFIIQHHDLTKADESYIFFLSIGIGLFFTLVLFISAQFIEKFYAFKGLSAVTKVLSLHFIFSSFSFVPRGLVERKLNFKVSGLIELFSSVASGIVALVMAFKGFGYWSLVIRDLVTYFLMGLLFFYYSKWIPSLKFSSNKIKEIIGYSGNITLFGIVNYWARNIDNLLIGKYLGSISLGYYNRAYTLMKYPIQIFSTVLNPVLHPVLAKLQNDVHALRKHYLDILKIMAIISFPMVTFLVVNANSIIKIVWGNQWGQSVVIFQILGLASLFQPILNTTGTIYLVRNKTNLLFKVGVINTIVIVAGIFIGMQFGLKGVAYGYTISFLITVIPILYLVLNVLLQGSVWEFFHKTASSFALVSVLFIVNLSVVIFIGQNMYISLLINTLLTIVLYYLFLRFYEKNLYLMLVSKLQGIKKRFI